MGMTTDEARIRALRAAKRLGLGLTTAAAITALAACGQQSDDSAAAPEPETPAPAADMTDGAPAAGAATAAGDEGADDGAVGDEAADDEVPFEVALQERLLDAQPGDVIEIPEGVYELTRSLSLTVDGVTIRGAGMDKTVLSFANQRQGAEGLLVTANDFTLEAIAFEDTIGDAVKINEGENIILRGVRVEWTNGPDTDNGAYGLYPVQTTNVLIEDCVAIGASDAGIYVGQSNNVIVRNSRAEYNVAGIEIENTIGADVYGNVATNNTGGILVFNMPNLPQTGEGTRVYRNTVVENNTENFGHPGTAVAGVPAGTGVIINANDGIEVFDNDIARNKTSNIMITSIFSADYGDGEWAPNFDPYPEGIFITGNRFEGGGGNPDVLELQALRIAKYGPMGRLPDIVWDGYVNPDKLVDGVLPVEDRICVDNDGAEVLNIDGPNENANPRVDTAFHTCTLDRLPEIDLGGLGDE